MSKQTSKPPVQKQDKHDKKRNMKRIRQSGKK